MPTFMLGRQLPTTRKKAQKHFTWCYQIRKPEGDEKSDTFRNEVKNRVKWLKFVNNTKTIITFKTVSIQL